MTNSVHAFGLHPEIDFNEDFGSVIFWRVIPISPTAWRNGGGLLTLTVDRSYQKGKHMRAQAGRFQNSARDHDGTSSLITPPTKRDGEPTLKLMICVRRRASGERPKNPYGRSLLGKRMNRKYPA